MSEVLTSTTLPAPAPEVNPETKEYWDATAQGKLLLKRCDDCKAVIWYPRAICPVCHSTNTSWFEGSGKGTVYTFSVVRRAGGPYAKATPFILAYVELEEGPRMVTNVVDIEPENLQVGQAVEVVFHDTGEGSALPRFRPAS